MVFQHPGNLTQSGIGSLIGIFLLTLGSGARGQTNQISTGSDICSPLRTTPVVMVASVKHSQRTNTFQLESQIHHRDSETNCVSSSFFLTKGKTPDRGLDGIITRSQAEKGFLQSLNPFAPQSGRRNADRAPGVWSGLPGGRPPARSIQNPGVGDIPGIILFWR